MKTYDVECFASIKLTKRVQAESPEEARDKAEKIWYEELKAGEYILDKDSLTDDCRVFDEDGNELTEEVE